MCGGKGSIRYGVCLPHFIPPLAPSLGLPGFGLQASGFPISITNLSESPTILDSADFCLEKIEVIPTPLSQKPTKCLMIFARISYLEWGSGF